MCEEEENGGLGRPKTGASLPQYIIQCEYDLFELLLRMSIEF